MQNITELRQRLNDIFEKTSKKEMSIVQAKALANIAGKIINSLAVELSYNQYMEITKKIEYLEQNAVTHEILTDAELEAIVNSK